jgi:catechol 2,3-dioxygenase-like lactoylglutathione lyase family enzyme
MDSPPLRVEDDRTMARLVGVNHVALEVGDVNEALTWYARFFEFELRGRAGQTMAFIDMGDQLSRWSPDGLNPRTGHGTSAWWSTTRRQPGRR